MKIYFVATQEEMQDTARRIAAEVAGKFESCRGVNAIGYPSIRVLSHDNRIEFARVERVSPASCSVGTVVDIGRRAPDPDIVLADGENMADPFAGEPLNEVRRG